MRLLLHGQEEKAPCLEPWAIFNEIGETWRRLCMQCFYQQRSRRSTRRGLTTQFSSSPRSLLRTGTFIYLFHFNFTGVGVKGPSFWVTIKISKKDLGRFLGLVTETFVLPIWFNTKGVKYSWKEYSYAFTNIIFEIFDPINTKMVYNIYPFLRSSS